MRSRLLHRLCICACLLLAGLTLTAAAPQPSAPVKPVIVIYFNDGTELAHQHADMISRMVRELSGFYNTKITEMPLAAESELPGQIDRIADEDVGLVLIIAPKNIEALAKIPSLYPDVNFTIIGANAPLYFTNVRAMNFRDHEGTFMMGSLAALRTQTGTISFISSQDNTVTRNLAYAYLQGAKHANPEVKVVQQLGVKPKGKSGEKSEGVQPDIVFVQDEELLEPTLRNAKAQKQMIITNNHDIIARHPGLVLTCLLRHYDLAMYQTLRSYSRGEWKPGSQSMGIGSGFIDYVLTGSNKQYLPRETIEQIETVKDFVAQGLVQVNHLVQ
ncbi:MAG: BMP family ABC transporter substrate-binding protein [Proteobacteria bacterium]|nr:BMP family ABC transporter substrate-binding protein [Pseudomonadota bacterium]